MPRTRRAGALVSPSGGDLEERRLRPDLPLAKHAGPLSARRAGTTTPSGSIRRTSNHVIVGGVTRFRSTDGVNFVRTWAAACTRTITRFVSRARLRRRWQSPRLLRQRRRRVPARGRARHDVHAPEQQLRRHAVLRRRRPEQRPARSSAARRTTARWSTRLPAARRPGRRWPAATAGTRRPIRRTPATSTASSSGSACTAARTAARRPRRSPAAAARRPLVGFVRADHELHLADSARSEPPGPAAGGRSIALAEQRGANHGLWASIKPPTPANQNISAIAVQTGNSNVIWVGHNNGDVYKTTNGLDAAPPG